MTSPTDLSGVDLTDLDNFANGFPRDLFDLHRRQSSAWWLEPPENTPDGEGFWSVAGYDEVRAVLRDPATYSLTGGERPLRRHSAAGHADRRARLRRG